MRTDSVLGRAGWSADRKTFPEAATRVVADLGAFPSRAFRVLMAEEVVAYRAGLWGADRRGRAAFIG